MRKPKLYLDALKPPGPTPREKSTSLAEQQERARQIKFAAQAALIGSPVEDPKPVRESNYYRGHYTGITWRGVPITPKKNKWGW